MVEKIPKNIALFSGSKFNLNVFVSMNNINNVPKLGSNHSVSLLPNSRASSRNVRSRQQPRAIVSIRFYSLNDNFSNLWRGSSYPSYIFEGLIISELHQC